MTTKKEVNHFFRELRKKGYIAKHSLRVTLNEAWALLEEAYRVPTGDIKRMVFYTRQEEVSFQKHPITGIYYLVEPLYLNWTGDGDEIIGIAHSVGLQTSWERTVNHQIVIQPRSMDVSYIESLSSEVVHPIDEDKK